MNNSLVISSFGTLVILKGLSSNTLGGAFAVLLGVVIDAIGVPTLIIGSSLLFIGKKYKKSKGWKFKAVQVN